jgi:hypothetical protein
MIVARKLEELSENWTVIHWILDKLADSCVCDTTRKHCDTRNQRGAQEMLDYRQRFLDRALQLENCTQDASQRCV